MRWIMGNLIAAVCSVFGADTSFEVASIGALTMC